RRCLPADEYSVRVRVIVEVHVLGFVERRLDGVIAAGLVRRIPVRDRRARRHAEVLGITRELRAFQPRPALLLTGLDFPCPTRDGNPASGNGTGGLLSLRPNRGGDEDGECNCERGTVD